MRLPRSSPRVRGLGQLGRLIEISSALSLDVFDTALLRMVAEPADLFPLIGLEYRQGQPDRGAFDFGTARIAAERRARERAYRAGKLDVSFDQIYDELIVPKDWDRAALQQIELRLERELSRPNPFILDAYRHALELGKPVVFVSDMYLPRDFIVELLRDAGYPYGTVFVSSDIGLTKASGKLFDHVRKEARLDSRALHVGDNWIADVRSAGQAGLRTYHYRRPAEIQAKSVPSSVSDAPAVSVQRALGQHRLFSDPVQKAGSFWYRFGYGQIGILYLGFTLWLRERLRADGITQVFFLARDGHVLRSAFGEVAGDEFSTHYLYASRRAMAIPAMSNVDEEAQRFLEAAMASMSVADYLARIHIDYRSVLTDIQAVGFAHPTQPFSERQDYDRLRELFQRIEPAIVASARAERNLLLGYLEQAGFFSSPRVAVVDLGWNGTIQSSLSRIMDEEGRKTEIVGYYLGTFASAKAHRARGLRMNGFLCEEGEPKERLRVITQCVEIFEFAHTAPHGTVTRFHKEPNGTILPELAVSEEPQEQIDAAIEVQRGGLDFMRDYMALHRRHNWLEIGPTAALSSLQRVISAPTREEARHLGDVVHSDGFGAIGKTRPLAQPPGWWSILRHPYTTWDHYHKAFWREGYVTRLVGRNPTLRRVLGSLITMAEKRFARKR